MVSTVLFFWFLFRDYLFWRLVDWLHLMPHAYFPHFTVRAFPDCCRYSVHVRRWIRDCCIAKALKQRVEKFQFPFKSRFRFLLAFAVFFSHIFVVIQFRGPIELERNVIPRRLNNSSIGFEYALFPILLVGLIACSCQHESGRLQNALEFGARAARPP